MAAPTKPARTRAKTLWEKRRFSYGINETLDSQAPHFNGHVGGRIDKPRKLLKRLIRRR